MPWHYSIDGEEHGPFEAAEFRRLAVSGAFTPDDLVWQTGAPQWVAARAVTGLFPHDAVNEALPAVTTAATRNSSKGKTMARSRTGTARSSPTSRRRREFPALNITAGFFMLLGALAGVGMLLGLAGVLSQAQLPIEAKALVGILGLLLTCAVVVTYFAVAEMIRPALYVARLLEEIRDGLRDKE
jgi:hypothetical protein